MTHAPSRPPLPVGDVEEAAAELRRAGGRLTRPRRQVLEALFAADEPATAEAIAADAAVELTSVYRTLEQLEDLGLVRHVHLGHGPGRYALAGAVEREYLVCDRCDRVTAVPAQRLDGVRAAIREGFGYRAAFSHFPIVGVCADCADR